MRNHFHRPTLEPGVLAGFEDEEEIAGMFGVDAEIVHGAFGVSFGVGGKPAFCLYRNNLAKLRHE